MAIECANGVRYDGDVGERQSRIQRQRQYFVGGAVGMRAVGRVESCKRGLAWQRNRIVNQRFDPRRTQMVLQRRSLSRSDRKQMIGVAGIELWWNRDADANETAPVFGRERAALGGPCAKPRKARPENRGLQF